MAEFKCIHKCGIFHSSSYFMSCISENHLRFAYMINFPFLVIKKDYICSQVYFLCKSHKRKSLVFSFHSLPLWHRNEDNTEMWSNLTNSKAVEIEIHIFNTDSRLGHLLAFSLPSDLMACCGDLLFNFEFHLAKKEAIAYQIFLNWESNLFYFFKDFFLDVDHF